MATESKRRRRATGQGWRKPARPPAVDPDLPFHRRQAGGQAAGGCRYPHGDIETRTLRFCGDPVRGPGEPYCEAHHALCHTRGGYRGKPPGADFSFHKRHFCDSVRL